MAVGFDEAVTGDVFRVDVMFAEREDEGRSEDRRTNGAEVVAKEVHQARHEVGEKIAQYSANNPGRDRKIADRGEMIDVEREYGEENRKSEDAERVDDFDV